MKRFAVAAMALLCVAQGPPVTNATRMRDTLQKMRVIDAAIELYAADHHGAPPPATDYASLTRLVVPDYVKGLPRSDEFGHDFIYATSGNGWRIVSHGDGSSDVVMENGIFTTSVTPSLAVPWKPTLEAPLAHPSGTKSNIKQLANEVNQAKARKTMSHMWLIAAGVRLYKKDFGRYPIAHTIGDLARLIEPKYVPKMPRLDEWQAPFYYASNDEGTSFDLTSGGANYYDDHDYPAAYVKSDDFASDAILENEHFLREWLGTEGEIARTTAPPPTAQPSHTPVQWVLEIVQDGKAIAPQDGIINLRRAPFTIRTISATNVDVRLNALDDDRVYSRIYSGFDFASCRKVIIALCNGTAMAEEDDNPQKQLILSPDAMHYLTVGRWNRTSFGSGAFVNERDVARIGDTPIEKTKMREIYLTVVVLTDSTVVTEDALRKLRLRF